MLVQGVTMTNTTESPYVEVSGACETDVRTSVAEIWGPAGLTVKGRLTGSSRIMQGLVGRSYSESSNETFDSFCKRRGN